MDYDNLDMDVVRLGQAIKGQESNYGRNTVSKETIANGTRGAFQYKQDTFSRQGKALGGKDLNGNPLNLDDEEHQNLVWYTWAKKLKDEGYGIDQIAAAHNAGEGFLTGWENHQGVNKKSGFAYNTPKYVNDVVSRYQNLKQTGSIPATAELPDGTRLSSVDATIPEAKKKSFGEKALNVASDLTGQTGIAEDIAALIGGGQYKKQFEAMEQSDKDVLDNFISHLNKAKQEGNEKAINHYKTLVENYQPMNMDGMTVKEVFPGMDKSLEQYLGDIGQSALGLAGGEILGGVAGGALKGASTAGKLVFGAKTGAIFGAAASGLGAMQENKDLAGVATDTAKGGALGAAIGFATAGLGAVVGKAYKKIGNFISGAGEKSADDILATSPDNVSKLTAREQRYYYSEQRKALTQATNEATAAAKTAAAKSLKETEEQIVDFGQKAGNITREKAISLKDPAQKLMKDASAEYTHLSGEAAEGSTALGNKVSHSDIAKTIDKELEDKVFNGNIVEDNKALRESLKKELGITDDAEKTITNQEVLDKARDIMAGVSKASKQGSKTYSAAEYEALKKYRALMETLNSNGVDMSAANKFWKTWAPVRDRIVREIRPFEEAGTSKMAIQTTLRNAAGVAKTPAQVTSKLDAQNFVRTLEERMKLPKGTLTDDIAKELEGLDKAKLSKKTIKEVTDETIRQMKLDKAEALKSMSLEKYNNESKALKRERNKKAIINALKFLGITGVGVKAFEVLN